MAEQQRNPSEKVIQGEFGGFGYCYIGGLAFDGADDVRHIGAGFPRFIQPIPHFGVDFPIVRRRNFGIAQAGFALHHQVFHGGSTSRDAHNGGFEIMGQSAGHLAQRGQPLLFHHADMAILEPLHAFLDFGDVLEDNHEPLNPFLDDQRGDLGHIGQSGELVVLNHLDRLLIGDVALSGTTCLDGGDQVVHGAAVLEIFVL